MNTTGSATLIIFMALVEQLIAAPGGDTSTHIRRYVLGNLKKIPTAPQERWNIHNWINQKSPLTETMPKLNTMRHVIYFAYIALCEYLGPASADQIMQNALRKLKQAHPDSRFQHLF